MSFCPNCGTELSESEKFCHSCGTAINAVQVTDQNIPSNINSKSKEEVLNKLSYYIDYFSQFENDFRYFSYCVNRTTEPKFKIWRYVVFLIMLGIFILPFLVTLVLFISEESGEGIIFSLVILGIFSIPLIFCIKGIKRTLKAKKDLPMLSESLNQCYANFDDKSIGIQYVFPWILKELAMYIQNGRADTVKETINVYETEQHNRTMKRLAKETASAAKAAAANTAATYFKL